ncbi:MAG: hypothetical protein HYX67_13515 [Candidatus Melainabacteria bacterium]|nr:hypothetical protein [Candidatus Melainabacteria bacterium]
MNSEIEAAEKAEFIQSVKSLLIPLCLFLACVIMAAGTFLIYNHEPLGWFFAGLATLIIIASMVAFIRFQNKHRARGILKHGTDPEIIDDQQPEQVTQSPTAETTAIDEEPQAVETSNVVEFKPNKQRLNQ